MKAAILGHPVAHSLSPLIHNAAYAELGLDDWVYERFDVTEDHLDEFLDSHESQWAGFSLTMPLKERVVGLSDEQDASVIRTGVANTLIIRDGRRLVYNTDIDGIKFALAQISVTSISSARVIGAGSTARSAVAAVRDLGATHVQVAVRRVGAAADIDDVVECSLEEGTDVDVVINTIPHDATEHVPAMSCALLDVIYHPWPTSLASRWLGPVVSGHRMLLGQAIPQVQYMTGHQVSPAVIDAMERALAQGL